MTNQRLELTWIGKGEEPAVEPRILLHDAGRDYGDPNAENMLIHGDNLLALKALEQEYAGQVKCIYIDPPYNTGSAFEYFEDNLEHSIWLNLMYQRLVVLKNLLMDGGSIWISIDNTEAHYLKVICDEVFLRSNFVADITYEKSNVSGLGQGGTIVNTGEKILVYKKGNPEFNEVLGSERLALKTMKRYSKVLYDEGEKELVEEFPAASNGLPVKIFKHFGYNVGTISLRDFSNRENEIRQEFYTNFKRMFRTYVIQQENEFQNALMGKMLRESYTAKSYSYNSKYIKNALALRPPQEDSLEIFAKLCDVLSLKKDANLEQELAAVRMLCPTLTSFEWDFPSVCFALATGIGKTRLMGACIAYLHYEKGIRNFFVVAPSLTIYNKLKSDLGDPSSRKYVFGGLDKFVTPPRIVDGDNYDEFRQGAFGTSDIVINVFNISKLNSDSKAEKGKPARIKRLNEVLGESYFSYLCSLPDLCVFMDESHHYRADKSFGVINELRPILGVELTATPQVQKNSRKVLFQNVVYEYSLAHALNDGKYVKVPAVITRKDFRPEEYTPEQLDREKLNDGLRIHEDIKSYLEIYSRTYGKPLVKPFVLVVARDTEHSRQIREYLTSDEFFRGDYKGKVLEINSAQRGAEKDENIEQLLSLEKPENKIEIVIHVNMLKEGWDVTNLYTIVPLRTSASETLTEQTIGRGLRLPFGSRTGVPEIDRLSIVSHDKYAAIVDLANDPNSLVRKVIILTR